MCDASTIVGAALKDDSRPYRALVQALGTTSVAWSIPIDGEVASVLKRPKLARRMLPGRGDMILQALRERVVWFQPIIRVQDCRDPKDDMYLELALAAAANAIISSDADLLVLSPWRGIRILTPAAYLVEG